MAKQLLVITLLSNDQPGVVQQLAELISLHEGNWLESRMSQLAGKFAGILKVSINREQVTALTTSLNTLSEHGIQILIDNTTEETPASNGKVLTFEVAGADRVGIVSEISHAFSEKGINIDELETWCSSIPWSGDPLFKATGALLAPLDINTEKLLEHLDNIENTLGVDISLNEQL